VEQFILQNDVIIRISAFTFILLLMVSMEYLIPRRQVPVNWNRRINNLALVGIDVLIIRILFPIAVVGMAELCAANSWGILHLYDTGFWMALIISLVTMDLAIYGQHVLLHHLRERTLAGTSMATALFNTLRQTTRLLTKFKKMKKFL